MKIAIHHSPGSFSERWIEYCKKNNIQYKIVNAYANDIIKQVEDCDAFMWHHHHGNYKDVLFAKQLLYSLQIAGKKVFPDFNTGWHFDDKVGQKYLLESVGAPLVPSYVFYTQKEAFEWINKTSFPKVFKLRGGAGAANVKLVKSKSEAKLLVRKAFGSGFSQFNRIGYLRERYNKYKSGKDTFIGVLKGFYRLFIPIEYSKMHPKEKGYVYFQDFMEGNKYDTRLVVISCKYAFGEKRFARKNDFRASGSGSFSYSDIDEQFVRIAFDVASKLKVQSVAFDFIYDNNHNPRIVEMSFGFGVHGVEHCPGYWTNDIQWHEGGGFDFYGWMIEGILNNNK